MTTIRAHLNCAFATTKLHVSTAGSSIDRAAHALEIQRSTCRVRLQFSAQFLHRDRTATTAQIGIEIFRQLNRVMRIHLDVGSVPMPLAITPRAYRNRVPFLRDGNRRSSEKFFLLLLIRYFD